MLFWQAAGVYSIINLIIALIIFKKLNRNFISVFFLLCVCFLILFGFTGFLLFFGVDDVYKQFFEILSVFLYSLFPFFFIHFIIEFIGVAKTVVTKRVIGIIYFAGIFSYTMILLGLIPQPYDVSSGFTSSAQIFFLTWMSIYFTIGVAQLYSLAGGINYKKVKSNLLFTGFAILMLLLPGPFSESVITMIFPENSKAYFLTSILALAFSVYYVFRHKATETLFDSLKLALSVMKDIVLKTDENFRIEFVKGDVLNVLGYREVEMIGTNLGGYLNDKSYLEGYRELTEQKRMSEGFFDVDIARKDGTTFPMSFSFTPIIDNEDITGFIAIARDITERKRLEKELQQSNLNLELKVEERTKELAKVNNELKIDIDKRLETEKELKSANEHKDKLFSLIAHDLKSPFTAILGYSSYLSEDYDDLDKDEIILYANSINSSAESVFKLLTNLLDWSLSQSKDRKPSPVDFVFNEQIELAYKLFHKIAEEKNVKLINNLDKEIKMHADKNMIESVLRNLISNALKFSENGQITVSAEKINDFVTVCVQDTGVGISPADQEKLFSQNENLTRKGTQNEKGTGLGLILCKEFVEANGGKIWVDSEIDKGSKFYFTVKS